MRLLLAITAASLVGAAIGAGTAALKIRSQTPSGGGVVAVDHDAFDFGEMDTDAEGVHEFEFANRGTASLLLTPGATSCRCTVSEIANGVLAPGESTKVRVSWKSKRAAGPFHQSVTINTSDAMRPEVTLSIQGVFFDVLQAEPGEIAFGQILGTEPISRTARILCRAPKPPVGVVKIIMSDPDLEKFFTVETEPLTGDDLREFKGVFSGLLARVTAKPGLPLGRFQQRILLSTNLPSAAELDLPLSGTIVREISLAGDGWSDEDRVLNFGAVDGRVGARRKLVLVTRGPHAKETAFKIARVVPDFLKAEMISPRVAGGSEAVPAVLWLEVPPRDAPADYSGGDRGKLGEVVLETTNPNFRELQIRIRFLVKPTN